ncbi:MAG: DUF4390 domain-containing protein [Gemmatimonadetes bacterium]|nr:DUF4390 domain-containing protein [Gemmatimonadota bacterium]
MIASLGHRLLGPLAVVCVLAASAAAEDTLAVEQLGVRDGMLAAVVRLPEGFDAETRRSIDGGLPITVRFTAELWRKRRFWFDKQVDSRVRTFRVHYDPGEKLYSVTGAGRRRRETFESLDAALDRLSPRTVEIHPRWELEDKHEYFVSLEMAIQPLTLQEFRELDGWVSGRIRGEAGPDDEPDPEDEGGVSGAFFGFFLDLAGFGDKIHVAQSPGFRADRLTELIEAP